MALLAASDRLQNAIKYCTKVRKTGAAGKESVTPDMTLRYQLRLVCIKFIEVRKKRPQMPPLTDLVEI